MSSDEAGASSLYIAFQFLSLRSSGAYHSSVLRDGVWRTTHRSDAFAAQIPAFLE